LKGIQQHRLGWDHRKTFIIYFVVHLYFILGNRHLISSCLCALASFRQAAGRGIGNVTYNGWPVGLFSAGLWVFSGGRHQRVLYKEHLEYVVNVYPLSLLPVVIVKLHQYLQTYHRSATFYQ